MRPPCAGRNGNSERNTNPRGSLLCNPKLPAPTQVRCRELWIGYDLSPKIRVPFALHPGPSAGGFPVAVPDRPITDQPFPIFFSVAGEFRFFIAGPHRSPIFATR